ncbi:MAG: DMT family transporter [Acidobacteriota bacterium]|nr:DMT family transporter [Acidobacteriota bacterium]
MKSGNPHLQIHFCVVLWGFTAVFGRLISLPALPLVWWRMMLVAAMLATFPRIWREVRRLPVSLLAAYAGIGMIIALHWLTFYGAIKVANASVGATCMALGPVFLAIIEPLLVKRPFDYRELLLGAAVIPGVVLVVGGVPSGMRLGIAIGALSALLVAIFSTFNKLLVHRADPLAVTAIELSAGAALLTVVIALTPGRDASFVLPGARDAIYLVILAAGCTIVPFTIALVALRQLSAFAAQLAVNLEPVYAIILATMLLGEHRQLGPEFYAGVMIILTLVFAYPLIVRRTPAAAHPEELSAVEETRT